MKPDYQPRTMTAEAGTLLAVAYKETYPAHIVIGIDLTIGCSERAGRWSAFIKAIVDLKL